MPGYIGTLGTSVLSFSDYVGIGNTQDYWSFNLSSTSDINIGLTGLSADADVQLISSTGVIIASSTRGGSASEDINLNSQSAGLYSVRVYQYSGDTNYSLKLSTADPSNIIAAQENLGNLTTTPIARSGSIGNSNTSDIYQFSLASAGNLNIGLTGLSADADVRLIRDVNNNGVVDGSDVLFTSTRGGSASEDISLAGQAAGTYFAQVYQYSGATSYSLNLSNNSTSNIIAAQENLGNLTTTPIARSGSIGNTNTSDIYQFSLASTGNLNISLTGLSADADVRLIRDANNNGVVDGSDVLFTSTRGGSASEDISLAGQAAGTYFAQVYQYSGATSYSLNLSNNSTSNIIAAQENLGNLTTTPIARYGSIGNTNTSDIYQFSLASAGNLNIGLTGLSADADVRLIRDANNNGVVDGSDVLFTSSRGGSASEDISLAGQAAGTYFAQVYQYSGATSYSLKLSNTSRSDILAPQENLGDLRTPITRSGSIGNSNTSDMYQFSVGVVPLRLSATLSGLSSDADLRVIRDVNNDGIAQTAEIYASSTNGGTNNESLFNNVYQGNYFLQVYQYSGATNYNLAANISTIIN